jgi:starch synthase
VVAAEAGGAPEVVKDGTTGMLVPYGDERMLADALIKLLRNPALNRKMGSAGQDRVNELFTYDRFRARVAESVDSLLHPPGSLLAPAGQRSGV